MQYDKITQAFPKWNLEPPPLISQPIMVSGDVPYASILASPLNSDTHLCRFKVQPTEIFVIHQFSLKGYVPKIVDPILSPGDLEFKEVDDYNIQGKFEWNLEVSQDLNNLVTVGFRSGQIVFNEFSVQKGNFHPSVAEPGSNVSIRIKNFGLSGLPAPSGLEIVAHISGYAIQYKEYEKPDRSKLRGMG